MQRRQHGLLFHVRQGLLRAFAGHGQGRGGLGAPLPVERRPGDLQGLTQGQGAEVLTMLLNHAHETASRFDGVSRELPSKAATFF